MAGFVIHLAVAEEYLKNNKEYNINEREFLKGVVAPDLVDDKKITHHGANIQGVKKDILKEFFKEHKLENSYWLGYYLHLVTDYYFYNVYFSKNKSKNGSFYNDYDVLNEMILEKYKVKIIEDFKNIDKIQKSIKCKKGEPEVLKRDLICDFIDTLGKVKIEKNGDIKLNLKK